MALTGRLGTPTSRPGDLQPGNPGALVTTLPVLWKSGIPGTWFQLSTTDPNVYWDGGTDGLGFTRVSTFIYAASPSGTITTVISSTSVKALNLWTGSSNNAPPANWDQPSYDDSAWPAAVAATIFPGQIPTPGTTTIWTSSLPASNTQQVLVRQTFALPAGTVSSANIDLGVDDQLADSFTHVNGSTTSTPAGGGGHAVITLPASMFIGGATNLLAYWGQNTVPSNAWFSWKLTVTMYLPAPLVYWPPAHVFTETP